MVVDLTGWATCWRRLAAWWKSRGTAVEGGDDKNVGVVIGMTRDRTPVYWPAPSAEHASHVTLLAASGAGKTILAALGILGEVVHDQDVVREQREAVLVVDPKGDTVSALVHGLAAVAPHCLADLEYLNPFDGGFPFNVAKLALGKTPLDIRAAQLASLVSVVSTATGAQQHLGVGARQVDVIQNVILGALDCDNPRATVLWALDALVEQKGLKMLAQLTKSTRAKQFLQSAMLSDELRASCAARLRTAFAASDNLERLVTASSCVQFTDILAPGRIVLVNLGEPTGGLLSLQAFWANVVVRLAIEHLMERPSPWAGHHARLVVDEAQIVAPVLADVAERVLTTGRSRGVSLVTLSQGTTLIADASDTLLRVLMTNTPTRLVGRLSAQDAALFARELAPRHGCDESAKTIREKFATAVTNLPDREFFVLTPGGREQFRTVDVDLDAWREAAATRAEEIAAVKTRLALPETTTPRLTLRQAVAALEDDRKSKAPPKSKPANKSSPSASRARWG